MSINRTGELFSPEMSPEYTLRNFDDLEISKYKISPKDIGGDELAADSSLLIAVGSCMMEGVAIS